MNSVFQGLFTDSKEKLIGNALQALAAEEWEQTNPSVSELEAHFHALRRLFASKFGFATFTSTPG